MKDVTYIDYCERVSDVVLHIYCNLDRPLNVSELACRASVSPFHFQRLFRQISGETCIKLVRRLRLERAAWQLQNTFKSISEIAYQAGFDSLEAFSRAFRKSFATHATDFREAHWLSYRLLSANGAHYAPDRTPSFCPLSQPGQETPFQIEPIEPFQVSGRLHPGAPHLIGKTCLAFADELRQLGMDLRQNPILTFAPQLFQTAPVEEIKSYVAVRATLPHLPGMICATLGGGQHLVARFAGSGPELGDFWLRLWRETLPASGYEQRSRCCYQTLQQGLYANKPTVILAHLYIPVRVK